MRVLLCIFRCTTMLTKQQSVQCHNALNIYPTPLLPSSVPGYTALRLSGAAQLPAASATAPAWACVYARVSGPHGGASEAARFSF